MAYPGNPDLTPEAQERVLLSFRQAVRMFQDGNGEEAVIALDFVLRLDPAFEPATVLREQIAAGAKSIDLSAVIDQLQAPGEEEVQLLLVDAVDNFNEGRLLQAKEKAEKVLRELPGQGEARRLLSQIEKALENEAQIGRYLARARDRLDAGKIQDAADILTMAQALDPHHPGIAPMLRELQKAAGGAEAVRPARAASTPGTEAAEPASGSADGAAAGAEEIKFSFATEDELAGGPERGAQAAAPAVAGPDALAEPGPSAGLAASFDTNAAFVPEEGGAELSVHLETGESKASPEAAFSADAGDLAELFMDDEGEAEPARTAAAPGAEGGPNRIQELLSQGRRALQRDEPQEAIDIWSRIYLIDPANAEANEAIDEARRRLDELSRKLEHRLFEAQDAAEKGDTEEARRILEEILVVQPENLEARRLKAGLETRESGTEAPEIESAVPPVPGGAEPGKPGALDEIEENLFDAFSSEISGELEMGAGEAGEEGAGGRGGLSPQHWPKMRLALLGVGAVLVVLLGVWLGTRLTAGSRVADQRGTIDRTLAQAEELFHKGQVEEAVRLLEASRANGVDQERIARRLAKYRRAMATPTPTPVPEEATLAEQQFAKGAWLEAYRTAEEGLKQHPNDPGLVELRGRILGTENLVGSLVQAADDGDYETASAIARQLSNQYPKHAEFREELARDLFNLAVIELRNYNLTGAEVQLRQLVKLRPEDGETRRILIFIDKYKSRPADMQLRVFIGSLSLR